jgi:signal transduction histidine kinase
MTWGLGQLRRQEQRMTYVRWFGVAFGALSLSLERVYPDSTTEFRAWLVVACLAAGSFAIWGMSARTETDEGHRRLGALAFAFDWVIIVSIVWLFAFDDPYITWGLLLLLPMEGAMRYRLTGAVLSVVGLAGLFLAITFHRAELTGAEFDVTAYVFVVGLSALVAGVAGSMANQWHAQNRAFEQQSLMLAEVDELKDRFLAITSHEIRGPLTAIIAGVDTVRKKSGRLTPEQNERLLEMVSMQGHQLARIVDDLQVTSQIQSGQLALHPEWADLEKTIHQALEAADSKRRQHQLEVFIEPLECEMDSPRVGQIVRNLVENAYKYTPDRTRVSVTAKAVASGISIAVSDAGPGIPADKRDQLFEAFSRIEETSAGQEGVGLGLYVVSQLIAAMEGRIDLTSSPRGTTFEITIPCTARRNNEVRLDLIEGDGGKSAEA